jgi:hypothetical protein
MSILASCANLAWGLAGLPAHAAFVASLDDPRQHQLKLLQRSVARAADTAFGRDHGLDRVDSLEQFRRSVPIRVYDEFEPYISRIRSGEHRVLSSQPVRPDDQQRLDPRR